MQPNQTNNSYKTMRNYTIFTKPYNRYNIIENYFFKRLRESNIQSEQVQHESPNK